MAQEKRNFRSCSHGFTLVEISIVLMVIGLLTGGVLKGQELIANSRLKSLMGDVNSYRSATWTFKDAYGRLPGDLKNANRKIPNCLGNPTCLPAGGNEDNYVGTPNVGNWSHNDQSSINSEPTQFWIHLKLADLIQGMPDTKNKPKEDPNRTIISGTYPDSSLGGVFEIVHSTEVGDNQAGGHYFILRLSPTGDPHPSTAGSQVLSPKLLARLDRQFDDANPNTGTIMADDAANQCWDTASHEYVEASDNKICLTAFKF